jgi:hypothetical protein
MKVLHVASLGKASKKAVVYAVFSASSLMGLLDSIIFSKEPLSTTMP